VVGGCDYVYGGRSIFMNNPSSGETCIHQQYDALGVIKVVETATARSLYFDNHTVEQSRLTFDAPMQLPFEYQQVIEARILAHHSSHPVQRILMLGMGGGSIARQFHTLLPKASIHIVELRQAVIDVAYDYFDLPNVPEIESIQEDALTFIRDAPSQYEVIIVDIFDDAGLPEPFSSTEFQADLLKNTLPPSLILFNLWDNQSAIAHSQTQKVLKTWRSYANTHKNIMVKSYPIPSTENIILSIQKI